LHALRWFLPRLPRHLLTRRLPLLHLRVWLFRPAHHLWAFLAPRWRLHDWSLLAFNLLRHALRSRARHFMLHLLLRAASYAFTLRLLSLLHSLRLLCLLSCSLHGPLFVHLLSSLILFELVHLPPRVPVALGRLRSQVLHLLPTRRVLLVTLHVHLSGLLWTTSLFSLTLISKF
jgi:hypothetical protein